MIRIGLIFSTLLLLVSCGRWREDMVELTVDNQNKIAYSEYLCDRVYDNENKKLALLSAPVLLKFKDGAFSGSAALNLFFGELKFNQDGTLTLPPIGSTQMAGPEDLMREDRLLMDALNRLTSIRFSSETLKGFEAKLKVLSCVKWEVLDLVDETQEEMATEKATL